MEAKILSDAIISVLKEKKGSDITRIYVGDKTVIADYFIICDASNKTLVKALCDYAEEAAVGVGATVLRREGVSEGRWAVMDFGQVILHVFNKESRDFYRIERLWQDENNVETF